MTNPTEAPTREDQKKAVKDLLVLARDFDKANLGVTAHHLRTAHYMAKGYQEAMERTKAAEEENRRLQTERDFLANDQKPLERRMYDAERKARLAQAIAAEIVADLGITLFSRSSLSPDSWQYRVSAMALGQWHVFSQSEVI